MSEQPSDPVVESPDRVKRYVVIVVIVALLLAVWGVASRVITRDALAKEAQDAATQTVATVKPKSGPVSEALVLPGNVQAFFEAPIYARTNGYLKSWEVDIGTPVKKGQLLAVIETPEVDQQLSQAQADLATAQANYDLAKTTDERWQGLLKTESVSKQDADEKAGDAAAKKAALQSSLANVSRLRDLEGFKRVLAPFDGVLTQRTTDIGALINAGQSPGNSLFRVADTHRLRIYVLVPQPYAASVTPGMAADLIFVEHPGKVYPATVVFTARAIEPATRTLQVELQVDNAKAELFPGAYSEVHFKLTSPVTTVRVPVNAVIFRSSGNQLAIVGPDNKVKLQNFTQGRDFGREIEVVAGVELNDNVIVNPPDSIADGAPVRIAAPEPAPAQAAGAHS